MSVSVGGFAGLLREAAAVFESDEDWDWFVDGLAPPVLRALHHDWSWQAHEGQGAPALSDSGGEWRVWLLMAGRAFGKTYAGAQWVTEQARAHPGARIALVGASVDEVVKVMIEGPSGLIALARHDEPVEWVPTHSTLRFHSGAVAFVYSAAAGEKLRGPEHHFAWADELAKWERPDACWDNLMMGLRLGTRPRCMVTTTPRPIAALRRIKALKATALTEGRSFDNPHAQKAFLDWAAETYGATRLGRQELDGVLFEDVAGALFSREVLEASRQSGTLPREGLKRIVVGVDPPVSAEGDACGIVVCGLGADGTAYVLADCSVSGMRPEGWAAAVARAAEAWGADRVVAEKNQGGDMVESVLRSVDAGLPVKLVSASRGKAARAEPVTAQFETGRAKLAGRFPELEDELAGLTYGGGYEGPGNSPDRADAMVWAMTELARPERPMPRVTRL
ncbi:MAG TPA: terminase family protein [Allosphingosinicella sp.]|jgi:phage terminase large subunit-like protein